MILETSTVFVNVSLKPEFYKKILRVHYGSATTPFGKILLGWINTRLCYLVFCDDGHEIQLRKLIDLWPAATLMPDDNSAAKLAKQIFSSPLKENEFPILVQGSSFQIKVWQALLHTRPGQTISYSQLAQMAGSPKAQRAVGSALAANPIAYLIPCHRVIKKDGNLGNYRWGAGRKQSMLEWESKARGCLEKLDFLFECKAGEIFNRKNT